MEPVTGVFDWPAGSNRWFARCPDCGQDLGYRGTDHAKAEAHLADHRLRKHGAERLKELRIEAAGSDPATGGCLELKFDPSYPEALLLWKGHPIVMIRSLSFGTEDGEELDQRYFPAEGRFAIYSWDNEGTEGEWTGNMHAEGEFTGKPPSLWETSLTWPPRKDSRKNADDIHTWDDFYCGDCNEYHPPGLHREDDNADQG